MNVWLSPGWWHERRCRLAGELLVLRGLARVHPDDLDLPWAERRMVPLLRHNPAARQEIDRILERRSMVG